MKSTQPIKTEIIIAQYPGGEYPIYIGQGLLNQHELLLPHIRSNQIMLISNETIAPLYLKKIQTSILSSSETYQCDQFLLADGEKYKTLASFSQILDALAEKRHHRDTTLVALGGGVVGDITGFVAACYHRGVNFIQIPTTLLAQVDASIGGKTAVNHPLGKNLIGAFHQPQAVIIDIDTLATLPDREYRAGLAEVIKSALIKQADFFIWIEANSKYLLDRNPDALRHAIKQACLIKRHIVATDEREQTGERALLNFGHTFAHAIEQNLEYKNCLHGEAVALGMILAADLSQQLGWISKNDFERIFQLIQRVQLPTSLPNAINYDKLMQAMLNDKKILNNQLRLILLKSLGKAIITSEVPMEKIRTLLQRHK